MGMRSTEKKNRNPLEIMPFEEFEANCTVIVNCD